MAADFRPFLETIGSKVSAGTAQPAFAPHPAGAASSATPRTATGTTCGELKVELKRDGERITEIRVQCRCGEIIELACEY